MGDTTSVLSKVAKMVYSIEPEPALFSKAEQRFRNTSNVKIISGLSEDVLPKLLPTLSGNICFWLDGHFSGGITFKGPQETPILAELDAIGRNIAKMGKVVVMIDDIRCLALRIRNFCLSLSRLSCRLGEKTRSLWHIEQRLFCDKIAKSP